MSVFTEIYSSQYDNLYQKKNYHAECDLIEQAIKRYAKKSLKTLLDVGCGTGNHSIELSKRGFQVTGVDLSQSMLEEAARKSSNMHVTQRPVWQHGDLRDFDTGRRFEVGIMMFAVIGYLTTNDEVLQGLRNIRRQLEEGAIFICDFWYGPSVIATKPSDNVRLFETGLGRLIRTASTKLNAMEHTADVTFRLWMLQENELVSEICETHHLRFFFPKEFELLLNLAGFKLNSISAFPSLDEPLGEDTWNALVIAEAV
jgi:SAM-dependent methyltransferase